jgi:hypothetical protein
MTLIVQHQTVLGDETLAALLTEVGLGLLRRNLNDCLLLDRLLFHLDLLDLLDLLGLLLLLLLLGLGLTLLDLDLLLLLNLLVRLLMVDLDLLLL